MTDFAAQPAETGGLRVTSLSANPLDHYTDARLRERLIEVNAQIADLNVEISALTEQRQELQAEDRRRHMKAPLHLVKALLPAQEPASP